MDQPFLFHSLSFLDNTNNVLVIIFTCNLDLFYVPDFLYAVLPKLKPLSHHVWILQDFWYKLSRWLRNKPCIKASSFVPALHVHLRFVTADLKIMWLLNIQNQLKFPLRNKNICVVINVINVLSIFFFSCTKYFISRTQHTTIIPKCI